VDNENGLRLKAGYIEYKEGAFIRARALELLSEKETFRAQSLDYSIPKQEARFTGLLFSNQDFANLRAELGHGFLSEEVLIAKGVRAEKPALSGRNLGGGSEETGSLGRWKLYFSGRSKDPQRNGSFGKASPSFWVWKVKGGDAGSSGPSAFGLFG
jgi:hypothetical protein